MAPETKRLRQDLATESSWWWVFLVAGAAGSLDDAGRGRYRYEREAENVAGGAGQGWGARP
jgi:hypothetical protein